MVRPRCKCHLGLRFCTRSPVRPSQQALGWRLVFAADPPAPRLYGSACRFQPMHPRRASCPGPGLRVAYAPVPFVNLQCLVRFTRYLTRYCHFTFLNSSAKSPICKPKTQSLSLLSRGSRGEITKSSIESMVLTGSRGWHPKAPCQCLSRHLRRSAFVVTFAPAPPFPVSIFSVSAFVFCHAVTLTRRAPGGEKLCGRSAYTPQLRQRTIRQVHPRPSSHPPTINSPAINYPCCTLLHFVALLLHFCCTLKRSQNHCQQGLCSICCACCTQNHPLPGEKTFAPGRPPSPLDSCP